MLTVDGLATGLDTGQIIDGLLAIQQAQIDRVNERRQKLVEQQTAFRTVEARLLDLQTSVGGLQRIADNVFQRKQAFVSEESIEVSVSNVATPGVYSLRVDSLAQAHQIASNSFDTADATIANGKFTFQVGTEPPLEIIVNDGNNSLESLVAEINAARQDVAATTIDQGGTYRLLLTARNTGVANQIDVSFQPDDPSDTTPFPIFDLDNPVQAASDATIVLGQGAGALTLTSDKNQIDGLLPGVTMNLLQSDPAQTIDITIGRDIEPAREAIQEFVEAYNGVLDFVDEQQQFDPETGASSLLVGNRDLVSIRDRLTNLVASTVPGTNTAMNRFSAIGIRLDSRGRLTIRSSELDNVLNERVDNVTLDDVEKLFRIAGETSSSQVRFVFASNETEPTTQIVDGKVTVVPYEVEILQAAEKARVVGAYPLLASTTIDNTNDEFIVSVDGQVSDLLKLSHGLYTPQELADHLQELINDHDKLAGRDVSITLQNDYLEISSVGYGKSSRVELVSGTVLNTLGFSAGTSAEGQDVIGRFIVGSDDNGDPIVESATGRGQILRGDQPDGRTNGLEMRVVLAPSQVGQSFKTDVTVTRGLAAELNTTLDGLLNFGKLDDIDSTFVDQIESLDASIGRLNARFEAQQHSLVAEFAKLETTVSELQAAGSFLSNQLAGLPQFGR